MSYKYPESSPDPNIFADEITSRYYSSKTDELTEKYSKADNLFSKLFIKYLSPCSKILDTKCASS